jgi:hypothetical protein
MRDRRGAPWNLDANRTYTHTPLLTSKCTVLEHTIKIGHRINFEKTSILVRATNYKGHILKDTIKTHQYNNSFNGYNGFALSQV